MNASIKPRQTLEDDHVVCKEGNKLTPSQATLLKHFGVKMSEFRVSLVSRWVKASGEYSNVGTAEDEKKGKAKK